jgi:hypothetical protein
MEGIAALGAVPRIHELARCLVFHRAADCNFHNAHLSPRKLRTSDQKSAISCSTVLNA